MHKVNSQEKLEKPNKTVEPQPLSHAKKHGGIKGHSTGKQVSWPRNPKLVDELYNPTDDDTTDEEDYVPEENTPAPVNASTAANTSGSGSAAGSAAAPINSNNETSATAKPKK